MLRDDRPSTSDLPLIHESVVERIQALADYRPEPLRDLPHLVTDGDGKTRRVEGLADHLPE